jgi:hypothetical protein
VKCRPEHKGTNPRFFFQVLHGHGKLFNLSDKPEISHPHNDTGLFKE